jgi:hypothetical protein
LRYTTLHTFEIEKEINYLILPLKIEELTHIQVSISKLLRYLFHYCEIPTPAVHLIAPTAAKQILCDDQDLRGISLELLYQCLQGYDVSSSVYDILNKLILLLHYNYVTFED